MERSRAKVLHAKTCPATAIWLAVILSAFPARAIVHTEGAEPDPHDAELAQAQQSRVTEVMNVGVQTNVAMDLGETRENRTLVRLSMLLPVQISTDWKLVVFPLVPLRSIPPAGLAQERENGIGDAILRSYLTPSGPGKLRWGIGPAAQLPTATNDTIGTGRFSLGATAILSYRGEVWTWSFIVEHIHAVDGVTSKKDVALTVLFPSISYTFRNAVNLGLTSEAFYDWHGPAGGRWLVPVLATISKVTDVGKVPINMLFGAGPFVAAPANGPDWAVRLAMALLFPFERME